MRMLIFGLFFSAMMWGRPLDVKIESPYAILIDLDSGKVLYEKNSREEIYPASTTKIATVLCALKKGGDRLQEKIEASAEALKMTNEAAKVASEFTLPSHWLEPDGTMIYLKVREVMTLQDLLYGSMLESGNDAANVVAEYLGGAIPDFVDEMNAMVKSFGCRKTHFCNPHGLHHPDHKTCAYDMALIAREALKHPLFREIVEKAEYPIAKTNRRPAGKFIQGNALLRPKSEFYYEKAFGLKTGTTRRAKYNLVAGASNGQRNLLLVLHKGPTNRLRYLDAIKLFDAAFAEPQESRLLFKYGDTSFEKNLPKGNRPLIAMLMNDLFLNYYPSEEEEIVSELVWDDLTLPVAGGTEVATLRVRSKESGKILVEERILAGCGVEKRWIYKVISGPAFLGLLGIAALLGSSLRRYLNARRK